VASKENKIIRRAQALNELSRLSQLLADNLKVEVPDVRVTNRDADLGEIQRIESINELLAKVLESSGVKATVEPAPEVTEEVKELETVKKAKPSKKSAKVKRGSKRGSKQAKRSLKR
jgi:hypothetical protein